ncbi:HAMP domain-containing sensor histidine kinase [uncultured Clostridium sp.]|uniref:HAMP domain-containing sensor histidine kinase n=1 Tax=uncultured Clostridium sp. TaxID=59620 RepID=UPI0028EF753B|nr:HAMP domain-containing sensor histidine kinase [uncultured Clostridium sp.]
MIKGNFTVEFRKKGIVLGFVLMIVGIIAPFIINVYNFRIYDLLSSSITNNDKSELIIAAFRLVILNSLRGIPNYLGAFLIAESTSLKYKEVDIHYVKGCIAVILIPVVYTIINRIHNIHYDLGVPAITIMFAIVFLEKLNFSTVNFFKKSSIITLLLLGVQWMDIIPELSPFKFGRGETSQDIKNIASFIGASDVLTLTAVMLFLIFTVNALLVVKLVSDEHKLKITTEENKRVEKELGEARIKALEARNYIELRHLVHDLKTPLTSIQALVSVIELMEKDSKILSYLNRIEFSIDKLSEMISEILYEDKKKIIKTEELFNIILSQISPFPYAERIRYENSAKECNIYINKIRVSRAIINVLDNAYYAIDKENGSININVHKEEEQVIIDIMDDGIGIEDGILYKVWGTGFTTKESTGLGLNFIQNVINNHNGYVKIESEQNKGTCVKIVLPGVSNSEQN